MLEHKVWKDPEEGDLSEAQVWQTPFSILYELAATTQKTLPNAQGRPCRSRSSTRASTTSACAS